jgi:hypothetical protein
MSGDAKNTSLWADADVWIADVGTAFPASLDAAPGPGWSLVGLLDGEEGLTEAREEETSEHYAWGGGLYKRTKSKHKRTFRFVALEDNPATFRLVNPGSERTSADGVITSKIAIPTTDQVAVIFEVREGGRKKRRLVKTVEVTEVAEIKDSETEPTVYDLTALIFPEADGTLYVTVETDPAAA